MNATSLRHILSFLLILLLAGCGTPAERQVRQTLRCVEEVLAEHPDSALTLLTPLDTVSLAGEEQAWYAVLRTQADYKLNHPVTDSLPLLATAYYGTPRRPHYRAAMAWYYQGCAYKEMGKDYDAIASLLTASSLFPDTLGRYASFCQFELGKLYLDHLMLKEAVQHFQSYQQSSACQDDSLFAAYADYYLGRTYLYQKQYDKAEANFLSIIHSAAVIGKPYRDDAVFQLSKIAYYHHHDDNKALALLNDYIDASAQKDQIGAAYSLKADILRNLGSLDSAYAYYQKSIVCKPDVNTSCWSNKGLADLSGLLGHGDSTAYYISNYTLMLDSVYKKNHQETIDSIRARHQLELHCRDEAAHDFRMQVYYASVLAVAIVSFLIVTLLMDRKRKNTILHFHQQMSDIRLEQISHSSNDDIELDDDDASKDNLSNVAKSSMSISRSEYFTKQIEVCRRQFAESEWASLLNDNRANIKLGKKLNVSKSEALIRYTTDLLSNVLVELLNDHPELHRYDLEYCAMAILQFKVDEMAYCTQATAHAYYCRSSRIKKVLSDDWYKIVFGKPKTTSPVT